MQRTKPPFRADMVGSLLRTAPVKQARAQREKGAITAAQLKEVEDREIEKIIKKQEEIGLKLVTDGEFRRAWWHFDFFSMLDGVELYELDHGIQFQGVQTKMQSIKVTGKIGFSNHPMIEHFKFLKAHTKVTPKMCIPAPSQMHFRLEPGAVSEVGLSRAATPSSTISPWPIRTRSRPSTPPAAAICSSTTAPGPISARRWNCRRRATAASTSIICRRPTRPASTRRWRPSPPT